MAGHTLEANAPDRLTSAVVAAYILMADVLINIISKLEEGGAILGLYATLAKVVVGSHLALEALAA